MRFLASVAAVVLLIVIAWLAGRSFSRPAVAPPPPPTATPIVTPTEPGPQPTPSPIQHRLAGTVVGDVRYAVIEDLEGGNELYRPGQTVPGLGVLVEVGARSAVFEADGRRFELQLKAGPTATPEPTAEPVEDEGEDDELTEPSPGQTPARERDSSDSESSS